MLMAHEICVHIIVILGCHIYHVYSVRVIIRGYLVLWCWQNK